jgi:hypothetical protein
MTTIVTIPDGAPICCCGVAGGIETECWPGVLVPNTLTVTITESTNETCIPNQQFTIVRSGTGWYGLYTYDGTPELGFFSHTCDGSNTWVYDASEASSNPYDSSSSSPMQWVVEHTDSSGGACDGVTATYTVTD